MTAFYIATAFVVMGVGAWLLRRSRAVDESRLMMQQRRALARHTVVPRLVTVDVVRQAPLVSAASARSGFSGWRNRAPLSLGGWAPSGAPTFLFCFGSMAVAAAPVRSAVAAAVCEVPGRRQRQPPARCW